MRDTLVTFMLAVSIIGPMLLGVVEKFLADYWFSLAWSRGPGA